MAVKIPFGRVNAMVNRDESRISREVHDLYCFLLQHPTISQAPNRFKDILRSAVNYTPFGYIFRGLVSRGAAESIDTRLESAEKCDACAGLQRDHLYTWKETAEFLLSRPRMDLAEFWEELKRRNEVVLLLRSEHSKITGLQRSGAGSEAYARAGVQLLRIDVRAIKLAGNKAGLVRAYWPTATERVAAP